MCNCTRCSRRENYSYCVFFFQAEDGIRDLVRSRGLGDVYKRQGYDEVEKGIENAGEESNDGTENSTDQNKRSNNKSVNNNNSDENINEKPDDDVKFSSSSKYDFIPGDKIILYLSLIHI